MTGKVKGFLIRTVQSALDIVRLTVKPPKKITMSKVHYAVKKLVVKVITIKVFF